MRFTTITSGSSGNCAYIEGGSTAVLVDAGCTNYQLRDALAALGRCPEDISALLITHEHRDHVAGVVRFARRFHIPVFASEQTWPHIPHDGFFSQPQQHIFQYGLEIGDLAVDFFRLSHDAAQPVGFVFSCGGQRVGVATDSGFITPSMAEKLQDVDGLILEANHDRQMLLSGPYPYVLKQRVASEQGHLSNQQAGLALRVLAGPHTKAVLLAHLSETNNQPELARRQIRALLAQDWDEETRPLPALFVAPRKQPHPIIDLDADPGSWPRA